VIDIKKVSGVANCTRTSNSLDKLQSTARMARLEKRA